MHQSGGVIPDPRHSNQLFQVTNRRLPESPPMTDICGNASSASSSSHHSDPMFSPNEFNGYSGVNNNGMILGVHELHNNIIQDQAIQQSAQRPQHSQQQQQQQINFWQQNQNSQNQSPQEAQASVSTAQQTNGQPHGQSNQNQQSARLSYGNMENLYNMLQASNEGGLASPIIDEPSSRKRSRLDTPCETPALMQALSGLNGEYNGDENYNHQQAIKFHKFQEEQWNSLYDQNGRELQQLQVHVVADKGFTFSTIDNCFVNQKKNHFQISVHVEASDSMPPKFVACNGVLMPILDFKLEFCGVKAEMPTSEIRIRQSRNDRKTHPHTPVVFEIQERRMTKVTVPRLHFSETTLNNQRKNYRPNPEQKFFLLVARLFATVNDDMSVLIQSYASEKIIVRATNPRSFELPESTVGWQQNENALFTSGPVSIGTERQAGKLTVDGDIYLTGRVINPSDIRLKEDIVEKEAREALENLCKLRVVDYLFKPEVAEKWGLPEDQRKRTGLIAQELEAVLPDAVRDLGDYLTIDESRVFYETVLATKELCRLTGDLDTKIDEKVNEISKRLSEYAHKKKLASSMASNLNQDSKSYSSYSLASTATNFSSKRRSRRSGRRCHHDDIPPLCSSRVTQGTIFALFGVMTLCILTMSALYVLDWHNRNYGYYNKYYANNPGSKGEPANLVISPLQFMPTYQPDAPPLMEQCFTPSCRSFCCGETAQDSVEIVEQRNGLNKTSGIGRAPQFTTRSFGTGVMIKIPSLNATLDQRYCIEKSCNIRKGIFNLYVPVSKYMPDSSIEIQLEVPPNKIINNCGHLPEFNHKICPNARYSYREHPESHQIFDNIFELSVGSYIQSAYRFRIGYSTQACSIQNDDSPSGNFEDYNLIFYRTCSSPNATTPSHTF